MTFEQLDLIQPILEAVASEGYTTPTPIQAQSIPIVLQQKDLLGCAQTGTGKTAAFAIPIIQLLHNKLAGDRGPKAIKALILTPTRELAIQIDESFAAYGKHTGLRHTVVFGGVSQQSQVNALRRGIDILIATPGRLLDLIDQRIISLQQIEIFVLDEADRMLDMGFIHDVKKLITKLPAKRQTLFFSATMPPEIQVLANTILVNPVKVEVTPVSSTVDKIEQGIFFVEKKDKTSLLIHLLQNKSVLSALVFARTKHGADKIARSISQSGIRTEAIHGNKSQNARQNALSNFKNGTTRVLVATDIAARGIDVEQLTHVFNYDLPNIPETYVHRIGRTGRAGASGVAYSFCDAEEIPFLKDIHKLIAKTIPVIDENPFAMTVNGAVTHQPVQPRNISRRPYNGAHQSSGNSRRWHANNQQARAK